MNTAVFNHALYLTNRLHLEVRLYVDNARMTSGRGENKDASCEKCDGCSRYHVQFRTLSEFMRADIQMEFICFAFNCILLSSPHYVICAYTLLSELAGHTSFKMTRVWLVSSDK